MNSKTSSIILTMVVIASFIIIVIEIAPEVGASQTIYVDDSNTTPPWLGTPGDPYQYIQDGVNAAQPGDTVFVSIGTYDEDVTITKTINLTGEDRDSTIINSTNQMGIYVTNADFVNITGFTVVNGSWAGIRFMPSNNSLIENIRFDNNDDGIEMIDSNNTIIKNNIFTNNSEGIQLLRSTNITVEKNTCMDNGNAIYLHPDNFNNWIIGNNCTENGDGIYLSSASNYNNYIGYNNVSSLNYGIADFSGNGNIYINNIIRNCSKGFSIYPINNIQIINSSIINSTIYDIRVSFPNTLLTAINTTFNKSKVEFGSTTSILDVQWFLHINIIDYLGNPVPNAKVKIEDNLNGFYNEIFVTDVNGHIKWLTMTEYIEQDTTGDTIGEKTYYTPHRIIAWNDTLVGYAYPEPFINESKTINIILSNGTLLDLEKGWNLISLPRIQADTNLQNVLKSIEGRYGAVRWYNSTDFNDHWEHIKIGKPFGNDLNNLDHKMGFWIYITDPEGITLVVHGNKFIAQQDIELNKGWNHVGFPSNSNKTRIAGLNNLNFGDNVNKIICYNATSKTWEFLDTDNNYFELGKGYWMHLKVDKTWNVPI